MSTRIADHSASRAAPVRRPGRRRLRLAALGVALVAVHAACASTNVEPLAQDAPIASLEPDEQKLWKDSQTLERALQDHHLVYTDPILQEFLDEMTGDLLAAMDASRAPVRVRPLLDPTLNAFALPNGSIYLHSGLLVRIENAAQLGALLGHELTHVLERHALRRARSAQNRQVAAMTVLGTLAVAVAAVTGNAGLARDLLMLGSNVSETLIEIQVAGYGRDLERTADRRGLAAAVAAGYAPDEAASLYRLLLQLSEEGDPSEPYAYASHPLLEERVSSSEEAARASGQRAGRVDAPAYTEVVAELVLVDAEADIRRGRPDRARPVLERFALLRPRDPRFAALLARSVEATARSASDLDEAISHVERAAGLAPDDAALVRRLAMLHRARGSPGAARDAFERYLVLAPGAPDRPLVEALIAELSASAEEER